MSKIKLKIKKLGGCKQMDKTIFVKSLLNFFKVLKPFTVLPILASLQFILRKILYAQERKLQKTMMKGYFLVYEIDQALDHLPENINVISNLTVQDIIKKRDYLRQLLLRPNLTTKKIEKALFDLDNASQLLATVENHIYQDIDENEDDKDPYLFDDKPEDLENEEINKKNDPFFMDYFKDWDPNEGNEENNNLDNKQV